MTPSLALQKAIYEELSTTYLVVDGNTFEGSYPYILLGYEVYKQDKYVLHKESSHLLTINIWSDYNGLKEVKEITGDVIERIIDNFQNLNIECPYVITSADVYNLIYKQADNGSVDLGRALLTVEFNLLRTT